jgi:hypothetical protein
MRHRPTVVRLLGMFLPVVCVGVGLAQEQKYPEILDAKPMYKVGHNHPELAPVAPAAIVTQWNGSFTDLTNKKITYTMIGTDPSKGGVSSTIPVYIIPIKMKYGPSNGNMTFDPVATKLSNGLTVINNVIASPLFNPGVNFTQGGIDLGTTQYIDAFQRGNFWISVKKKKNAGYHVLLGTPTVLKEQIINVSSTQGSVISNPFGSGVVGTYDLIDFDSKLQSYMKKFSEINPGVLPLFITYDIYLTEGSCCYGGYHDADGVQPGGQTYAYSTYVDSVGAFAQDVSALSHEIGEWVNDPFADNHVHCTDNPLMEVGDPLENGSNYGAYPYTLDGFTYNLQSLVFIGYFGAPPKTSANSWYAFQNDMSHVCPGQ